jgi:hypothetical protein
MIKPLEPQYNFEVQLRSQVEPQDRRLGASTASPLQHHKPQSPQVHPHQFVQQIVQQQQQLQQHHVPDIRKSHQQAWVIPDASRVATPQAFSNTPVAMPPAQTASLANSDKSDKTILRPLSVSMANTGSLNNSLTNSTSALSEFQKSKAHIAWAAKHTSYAFLPNQPHASAAPNGSGVSVTPDAHTNSVMPLVSLLFRIQIVVFR